MGMIGLMVATAMTPSSTAPNVHSCGLESPATESVVSAQAAGPSPDSMARATHPDERNLRNLRQLTFGGQNAEAYWSKDGKRIVYQSLQPGYPDEQIFTMNADGSGKSLVSTGKGRCTCSYFTPDSKWIYFSSTHERNEGPQMKIDMRKGYVWMVNPDFALYRTKANPRPGEPRTYERVSDAPGAYMAETTIAPNGKFMTWTSTRDGDLEIYRSNLRGGDVVRLTSEEGYDGGPFVSWDSKKIVYRRDVAKTPVEREADRALLKENLVRPSRLEIWIMDADGRNKRQVTNLNCASFAPFLHPNGRTIIFSSNYGDPKGREFDLWTIDVNGKNLRRVTHSPDFDGFPMFTRDGKRLIFASNRYGAAKGETNVFVADWRND